MTSGYKFFLAKQVIPFSLAAALSFSSVIAFAAGTEVTENGGTGESAVTLTVSENQLAGVFSATIPAVIPAAIDSNGTVTVPNNIKIINNNQYRAIKATNISVTPSESWSLSDYDSGDFSEMNGKNFSVKLRNDPVSTDTKQVSLTDGNWKVLAGGTLDIPMGLKVSPQNKIGSLGNIASISFTLDWADDSSGGGNSGSTDTPAEEESIVFHFEVDEHGTIRDADKTLKVPKKTIEAGNYRLTFPAVTAKSGYQFDKWVIVNSDGSETPFSSSAFTVTGETTFRAKFVEKDPTYANFTYYAGEHGKLKDFISGEKVTQTTNKFEVSSSGSFSFSFPDIIPDDEWMFDRWVNTSDGSDIGNGSGLKANPDGSFSVTATYKSSAIQVTYRTDSSDLSLIVDGVDNGQTATKTIYPDSSGKISVGFPTVRTSNGRVFVKWVNTATNNDTQNGIEMDEANRTMDFTAVSKEAPEIYLYPSAGEGGTISSTETIHMERGSTIKLPTATPNDGYTFDGWYYADGTAMRKNSSNDTYIIDSAHGTEDTSNNTLNFHITAKFIQSSSTQSLNEIEQTPTSIVFESELDS